MFKLNFTRIKSFVSIKQIEEINDNGKTLDMKMTPIVILDMFFLKLH